MTASTERKIALAAIGRNEGARLKACLRAASGQFSVMVYVDSGSSDGSPDVARAAGCVVVELDRSMPFSAARGRNEAFAELMRVAPDVDLIQFLDGDCELEPGWIAAGCALLDVRPDVGIVCGQVRELHPDETRYNKLCDLEWRMPAGEAKSSGGRFLIRTQAFQASGGFREDVIGAEDDEFCIRVRRAGWKVWVLDAPMAAHDAAMTKFAQWWARMRRAGHAYAQVSELHGGPPEFYFVRERRRVFVWGLAIPLAAIALSWGTSGLSLGAWLALIAWQYLRIVKYGRRRGWSGADARLYARFTVLAKFAEMHGMLSYYWRRLRGVRITIIEYKRGE